MSAPLKSVPPRRSEERQRLADAIQRHVDAVFQHERVDDALGKLDDQVFDQLEPAVRRAREALDEAHAAAPELLVARALGEPADPEAPTVADAEAALRDADKALVDARAARSLLRDELRAREHAAEMAKHAVGEAVKAVVNADATGRVIAEFTRAGRHFLAMSRVMRTIGVGHTGMSAADIGLGVTIHDMSPPGEFNKTLYRPEPAFHAVLAALETDADVNFPPLPSPDPDPDEPDPAPDPDPDPADAEVDRLIADADRKVEEARGSSGPEAEAA